MPHKFLPILLLTVALCACKEKSAPPVSHAPIEHYHLDGVVVSLDAQAHLAKIKGEKIDGWMEAMTMDYPVKDPQEFALLHPGDHITATVYVQDLNYWLAGIHPFR